MRGVGEILLVLFLAFIMIGVYGASSNPGLAGVPSTEGITTEGQAPQSDPFAEDYWKIELLGAVLITGFLAIAVYTVTRYEDVGCLGEIGGPLMGTPVIIGPWLWAGALGHFGFWFGMIAGVLAIILNAAIIILVTGKALDDKYK
jgi:hypothetical protein